MAKVLLVFPAKTKEFTNLYPPLGLSYMASMLKMDGHQVKGIDLRLQSYKKYKECLLKWKPNWIGISMETVGYDNANLAVNFARKYSSAKIIVGGVHPTLEPFGVLENENIDVVAVGEAENTIKDIVAGKPYDKIDGVAYRGKTKNILREKKNYIENLDTIPFPDRSIFPINEYIKTNWMEFPLPPPVFTVIGGRGCPYQCTFCAPTLSRIFGKKLRFRSPQNVVDELNFLIKKYKLRSFYLADDLPTCNPKWIREFCSLMIKNKLHKRLSWSCNTRSNIMTDELAKLLKKAGCIIIYIGVESGSQKVLNFYNKGIKPEYSKRTAKVCQRNGLIVLINLMFGAPMETIEDLEDTYNLFREINPDMARTSITSPLPHTYLYEECKEKDLLCNIKYKDYSNSLSVQKIKTVTPMRIISEYQHKMARYVPRLDFIFTRPYYTKAVLKWFWGVLITGQIFKMLWKAPSVYLKFGKMRASLKS